MPNWVRVLFAVALGLVGAGGTVTPLYAAGKTQAVAVMPFRDLSAGSRYVGEAIRETVTTDLKQLGSLRVVERGNLDKVLGEQNLQLQTQEPDTATLVKIGKILGANLIVVGAYQKVLPQVRLTARFIKVETSEILGTAKVDGSTREFLRLQDRVTAALLKSAGFPVHAKQVLDGAERRPEMGSLKTLELYGQAVMASNDNERRQYLSLAVAEDKNFSYAVKDLAELEKRIRIYQATSLQVHEREVVVLREKLKVLTTRPEIEQTELMLLAKLAMARRQHELVREAKAFLDGLSPGSPITVWVDGVASQMISTLITLKRWDDVLREGERFMARAPGSSVFSAVKSMVQLAIQRKRALEDGVAKAQREVENLSSSSRWDLCLVANLYQRNEQYESASRLYRACMQLGTQPKSEILSQLCQGAFQQGRWVELRQTLAEWMKEDETAALRFQNSYESSIPLDD
jgi:TolB-like protein